MILAHEFTHAQEGSVLDSENRFMRAWRAHIAEYKAVFGASDDPISVGIEDRANKVLKYVLEKENVPQEIIDHVIKTEESTAYKSQYVMWEIVNRIVVIIKSVFAVYIIGLFGFLFGKAWRLLFGKKKTQRSRLTYDDSFRRRSVLDDQKVSPRRAARRKSKTSGNAVFKKEDGFSPLVVLPFIVAGIAVGAFFLGYATLAAMNWTCGF